MVSTIGSSGVVPPGFSFPRPVVGAEAQSEVGLYTPFKMPEVDPEARVIGVVQAIARLADGATAVQAAVEGTAHARGVDRPFADLVFGEGAARWRFECVRWWSR